MVLVDHAAEASPASYGSIHRDHEGRVVVRRQLLPTLMRAVIVEVVHVLADHREGVSFVVDQQPVGALPTQATTPPFDETVRPQTTSAPRSASSTAANRDRPEPG